MDISLDDEAKAVESERISLQDSSLDKLSKTKQAAIIHYFEGNFIIEDILITLKDGYSIIAAFDIFYRVLRVITKIRYNKRNKELIQIN